MYVQIHESQNLSGCCWLWPAVTEVTALFLLFLSVILGQIFTEMFPRDIFTQKENNMYTCLHMYLLTVAICLKPEILQDVNFVLFLCACNHNTLNIVKHLPTPIEKRAGSDIVHAFLCYTYSLIYVSLHL